MTGPGLMAIFFLIAVIWGIALFFLPFFVWGISNKLDDMQKILIDIHTTLKEQHIK